MKHLILLFIAVSLISCSKTEKKEQPFDSFVYLYATVNIEYAVKFTNSDTVYFQKRSPKPQVTSYAIMEESQRESGIELIKKIDFTKYKSDYVQQSLVDGVGFRFETTKNNKEKSINVYGDNAPEALYTYATKFNELVKHLNFKPYNGRVDFGVLAPHKVVVLPAPKYIE